MGSLDALERLVSLVEEETGVNDACADADDGESVGAIRNTETGEVEECAMTFGDVRRARHELDVLKAGGLQ
jgi:hypothetical protein